MYYDKNGYPLKEGDVVIRDDGTKHIFKYVSMLRQYGLFQYVNSQQFNFSSIIADENGYINNITKSNTL